jgi:hypothetical protein
MKARQIAVVALTGVLLTGCGNSNSSTACCPAPPPQKAILRTAVQVYSNSYLTGKVSASYHLLSYRCRARMPIPKWTQLVTAAKSVYGSDLPIKSFKAEIHGGLARVTYTFVVRALDQDAEPWVKENGTWHEDDC